MGVLYLVHMGYYTGVLGRTAFHDKQVPGMVCCYGGFLDIVEDPPAYKLSHPLLSLGGRIDFV